MIGAGSNVELARAVAMRKAIVAGFCEAMEPVVPADGLDCDKGLPSDNFRNCTRKRGAL